MLIISAIKKSWHRLWQGRVMVVRPCDVLENNIKNTYLAKSDVHGTGLFASGEMRAGEVIGKLTGSRVHWSMYKALGLMRYVDLEWNAMPGDWLLIRQKKTKYAAINHSRNPNVELRDISQTEKEVVVLRRIAPGEEILLDYRKEPLPEEYKKAHGWSYL